jgi:hypothetical protein
LFFVVLLFFGKALEEQLLKGQEQALCQHFEVCDTKFLLLNNQIVMKCH